MFQNEIWYYNFLELINKVKLLLKDELKGRKRIDPSAKNNKSIRNASKYGYLEVVKNY